MNTFNEVIQDKILWYDQKLWYADIPDGLVVRIRRSHRRGRGSIPRLGVHFYKFTNIWKSCESGMFCKSACHDLIRYMLVTMKDQLFCQLKPRDSLQ